MKLYSYFRSSAAYRVRIALNLKRIEYSSIPLSLIDGDQRRDEYLVKNPQGLVPAIELESGEVLSQSVAILEWLEVTHPTPSLYPTDTLALAKYRADCLHVACDIHPLNNLRVLQYLKSEGLEQTQVDNWYSHWVQTGFVALEQTVASFAGDFSLGNRPGMLEVFLIPQIYNAKRFKVTLDAFPALVALDERCATIREFAIAHPSVQPDTPEAERV